jgi:hypothetical protein
MNKYMVQHLIKRQVEPCELYMDNFESFTIQSDQRSKNNGKTKR